MTIDIQPYKVHQVLLNEADALLDKMDDNNTGTIDYGLLDELISGCKCWNEALDKGYNPQNHTLSVINQIIETLKFYSAMPNYMAKMFENKPGFDFKHTPVHMDGGDRARILLEKLNRGNKT